MSRIFFAADHHFQHSNILTFKNNNGHPLRTFSDIDVHDQAIIDTHNAVVKEDDLVYFLGDVIWKTNSRARDIINSLKGRKRLCVGNHDDVNFLFPFFEKVYLWKYFPEHNLVASHVPIDHADLRGKRNVHGHLHEKAVKLNTGCSDFNYYNVSMERTRYQPILLNTVLKGFI